MGFVTEYCHKQSLLTKKRQNHKRMAEFIFVLLCFFVANLPLWLA
jgi:hypothetical protein